MQTFEEKAKATRQTNSAVSARPGRMLARQDSEVNFILHLQRTIGNQAVQRFLEGNWRDLKEDSTTTEIAHFGHDLRQIPIHPTSAGAMQTNLAISKSGDEYEQEADRVADQLMRMPKPQLQHTWPCGGRGFRSQTGRPSQEHEGLHTTRIQASDTGQIAAPPIVHEVLAAPGRPLDPATRDFMEPRFGHEFSEVRLHTSTRAAESAQALNAQAYTVGPHIVLGTGKYAPESYVGKKLLVHELTHVVQQGRGIDGPSHRLFRLTEEEKKENLKSGKYAGNRRLEKAFDNDPPLGIGESGEPVRLVQEGLVADGFDMPASTKPRGELDGAFGAETFTVVKRFQAKYGLTVDGIVGRETMRKLDDLNRSSVTPAPPSWSPAVDRIDIIDTPSGAATCFGDVMGDTDLNSPGPFNNPSTDAKYPFYGEVTNVHQIHFYLDRGDSSQLTPERFIDATYFHAWLPIHTTGPDGPQPFETCRPSPDKLAVADGPGVWHKDDQGYPFKLRAHFYLLVSDALGHRIAQVEYNVEIEKTNKNNVPNKVNRIYPTKKRDLVRNRDL